MVARLLRKTGFHFSSSRSGERLLHQRTELVNALGSVLHEYGHAFPKGIGHIKRIEAVLDEPSSDLPELVREECQDLIDQISEKTARIDVKTKKAKNLSLATDTARRLQTMPGVGPQTALAISGFAPPMESFKRGRDFAAWLGVRSVSRTDRVPARTATPIHLRRQGAAWAHFKGRSDRYPLSIDHRCDVTADLSGPQEDRRRIMAGTDVTPQAPHAGGNRACEQDGAGDLGNDDKEGRLSRSGASCGCMIHMHHHTSWRR